MKKGDRVSWRWGKYKAEGKIIQRFRKPVTKTLKGTKVKRNANEQEPAYLIRQAEGSKVLRSESELKKY